ncbi:MAG: tetratricopeptide repeat protein [Rhodobacteraceae bacterium]|nr:tetratricopeptide repeat protein [Paracoccaceae bacterium]
MAFHRKIAAVLLLCGAALLGACDSAEERAEKHFQSGMELLAAGDVDRALVEFRNVFQLNGKHHDARAVYARTLRERGELAESYSQYLRLVEQYPDDLEGRRALAEMAAESGDWDEVERHVTEALRVAPGDAGAQAVAIALRYARAAAGDDTEAQGKAAAEADAMLARAPANRFLHRVVIDHALKGKDFAGALRRIETALAVLPADPGLHALRVSALAALGDEAGVEAALIEMRNRFPGDRSADEALLRWYVARGESAKAEGLLRDRIAAPGSTPAAVVDLLRFIASDRGPQAALAEADARIAAGETAIEVEAARDALRFDLGDRDGAVAALQAALAAAAPSDAARDARAALAEMLGRMGNETGARALVEEVLAEDSGNVLAVRLKADALIRADAIGEAINLLRAALEQNPRDPSLMTLLARAHERNGSRDLMRDMLARAAEASGNAPEESMRYARVLIQGENLAAAEDVLIAALRTTPGEVRLLGLLGEVYLRMRDWARAGGVADALDRSGDPAAAQVAIGLRAAAVGGRESAEQALDYLKDLAEKGEGGLSTRIALIRAQLGQGKTAEALAAAERLAAENPADRSIGFVHAYVLDAAGRRAEAEAAYRALLADGGSEPRIWLALYRNVLADPARFDEAGRILDEAAAANPGAAEIRWARAGHAERAGDIEGAIAIYEGLYAEDSNDPIVANNLASLLAGYRTDAESLARAEVIARRLRGSEVPAFQDTYGWIAFRRGNAEEARAPLEKAAAALTGDASVQYHLGMVYAALGLKPEALAQFDRAIAAAGAGSRLPDAARAAEEAARLRAEGVAPKQ